MNKMNPEIKALWLTALRSGDYKQGGDVGLNGRFLGGEGSGLIPSVMWSTLIELNDSATYSFEQIADVIEEQF